MRIAIKSAELHTPLFLSGVNLGLKLDPARRDALELMFDRKEALLIVTFNEATAIIPAANVVSMVPADPEPFLAVPELVVAKEKSPIRFPSDKDRK